MADALDYRPKPSVLVLYNENPAWPQADLDDAGKMIECMSAGLAEQQYPHQCVKFFEDLSVLDAYDPREWLVWNWAEELGGRSWSDWQAAAELERRGFVFTGAGSAALRLTQNRLAVKEQLLAAGLPTLPARVFSDPAQAAAWDDFPAIVKGLNQHSSFGIGQESVVSDAEALARRIRYLREKFDDDALVERFLDSREFHVAVWGNAQPEALPSLELDYGVFDDMRDRLYTYEWKFERESRGFNEIKMIVPAPLDRPDWRASLEQVAVQAYQVLGLRDYGRIDMRMLGDVPQILDVNANPDLDLTSVLPMGAKVLGYSFGGLVDRILQSAAERLPVRAE